MNPIKTLLYATLLASATASALPTDRDQPIHIEADNAVRNQKAGITTYSGNVVMEQGSIHIKADKIVIHSNDKRVSRVIATGAPAHFQQQPAEDKAVVIARGNTLNYLVSDDKLSITDNAQVEQDGSLIAGDLIHYNIRRAVVEASGSTETKSRVKMILQPQKRNPTESDQQDTSN